MISDSLSPGDSTRFVEVDGQARSYLVHVPNSYDGAKAFPVVLCFHGGGTNAELMVTFCGLNEKADQAGFIVVYPNGTGKVRKFLTWNGGNCCGHAMANNVDDVAFVRALLDDLGSVVHIDSKRVYATGMSNGAVLAYRLASELSERIAAIAPVGGPMGFETCRPQRPVSVIHFHGTDDDYAPFQGGVGKKSVSRVHFFSVENSIQAWVQANGCNSEPIITQTPDLAQDGTLVTRRTYAGGRQGSEVVLIIIEGAGHTWPGRVPHLKVLGVSTQNICANDLLWEFFVNHTMA